ncbi:MAG: glycosyltransferase family 4 protein, partial [Sphingobacteriia bacterium]
MAHILQSIRTLRGCTGASNIVLQLSKELVNRGHKTTVMSRTINSEAVRAVGAKPVRVSPLLTKSREGWYRAVQRRISQANADLVIGHGDLMVQDVLFLHNMVKATHAALYGTTTCEDSDHGRLHEQILCQGQWKLVVANSPMMAEELQQRYAIPPPRILTLMPGIDLRRFCPAAPAQRAGMKQAMGLRPDKFVVGFITSGSFRKRGLDQFAQTVAQLAVPVQLLIVGRDEPGPYLRGLD